MVRRSKWIDGVAADQPVSDSACRALRVRLSVVWHYVPLAAERARDDIEYVHQLRVATRRGMAAMQAFDNVCPKGPGRWMCKCLKKLRKAAGDARDDDVLYLRLAEMQERHPGIEVLLECVKSHRREAQKPIRKIYRHLQRKRFDRRMDELIDRTAWRDKPIKEPTFGIAARQQLRPLVNDFFRCARADLNDFSKLHDLRIAGKQVRYAMEIFSAAFDDDFRRQLYPQVEQAQELLGEVNDHASARARFETWLTQTRDANSTTLLRQLALSEARAARRCRQKFRAWWRPEQVAQLRKQFAQHLGK